MAPIEKRKFQNTTNCAQFVLAWRRFARYDPRRITNTPRIGDRNRTPTENRNGFTYFTGYRAWSNSGVVGRRCARPGQWRRTRPIVPIRRQNTRHTGTFSARNRWGANISKDRSTMAPNFRHPARTRRPLPGPASTMIHCPQNPWSTPWSMAISSFITTIRPDVAMNLIRGWTDQYEGVWDGVIAVRHDDLGERVVFTAWQHRLELPKIDVRVSFFIDAFRGRGPENRVR